MHNAIKTKNKILIIFILCAVVTVVLFALIGANSFAQANNTVNSNVCQCQNCNNNCEDCDNEFCECLKFQNCPLQENTHRQGYVNCNAQYREQGCCNPQCQGYGNCNAQYQEQGCYNPQCQKYNEENLKADNACYQDCKQRRQKLHSNK